MQLAVKGCTTSYPKGSCLLAQFAPLSTRGTLSLPPPSVQLITHYPTGSSVPVPGRVPAFPVQWCDVLCCTTTGGSRCREGQAAATCGVRTRLINLPEASPRSARQTRRLEQRRCSAWRAGAAATAPAARCVRHRQLRLFWGINCNVQTVFLSALSDLEWLYRYSCNNCLWLSICSCNACLLPSADIIRCTCNNCLWLPICSCNNCLWL